MRVRTSSGVISFQPKINEIWKLQTWGGIGDEDKELLFFGMYVDNDYDVFYYLPDEFKKSIFWCGSDILRLLQDPERQRRVKLGDVKHYCENEVEAEELRSVGIEPIVIPSFLEDINNFPVSFRPSDKPQVWLCGHPNREEEYGFELVKAIAKELPEFTFHIYGVEGRDKKNVIYHGLVPNEQFNKEIKKYQCGLRTNEHDGFSEVTAKSLLMGQYPITRIKYEGIWDYNEPIILIKQLNRLKTMTEPNLEARSYYLKRFNNFPFCSREYWKPE